MQHARDRIRFMTMRARLAAPVEQVVQEINLFLRGWAGYFRYGNSAHAFDQISTLRGDPARVVHRETPPAWARLGVRPDLLLG